MSGISAVTRNGPMRSTPNWVASTTSRIMVLMPPMPEPMMAPVRHASASSSMGFGRPASAIASATAAQAKWTYRSFRRTSFFGMIVSASKPLISPATLLAVLTGSKVVIGPIPLRPLTRPSQKAATSFPMGVMAPMPVTTTRRSPSRISWPSSHLLVARDDDAQGRFDGHLSVDAGHAAHATEHAAQLLDRHLEAQRIAGNHHAPEAAIVDAREEAELAAILVEAHDADAGGLGQCLYHENAGHDRASGKVAGELRLVGGDLLDPHHAGSRLELHDTIDHQERIPVRDDAHDVGRLERQRQIHRSSLPRTRPDRPDPAGWC